jgi:TorA maturation chaperone TorD
MTVFSEAEFHSKRRRRQLAQRAARGMSDQEWRERDLSMARARKQAWMARQRAQSLSLNPWRDQVEASYPRGFEMDRESFASAYRSFWEPRP